MNMKWIAQLLISIAIYLIVFAIIAFIGLFAIGSVRIIYHIIGVFAIGYFCTNLAYWIIDKITDKHE